MSIKIPFVSKISVKAIIGTKPKIPDDNKINWLCQIYGVATSTKSGTSDKGDWTGLMGSFRGINSDTGNILGSGVCYLPNVALNLVLASLSNKENKAVEFGFTIGIKADEKSATGYVYVCEPIFEPSENDPLEMLTKKLPAPKGEKVAQIEHKKKA